MAKYIVEVTTRYQVEADSELEANIKAGIENSNVQLDEDGIRIDNYVQGIKYMGETLDGNLVDHSNDPSPYEDMASAQDIADEILRITLQDEMDEVPTDEDVLRAHLDALHDRIANGKFE